MTTEHKDKHKKGTPGPKVEDRKLPASKRYYEKRKVEAKNKSSPS